ncbi:MAG: hypothetical protein O2894_11820 [Planctomycetota bacterium]|nr:hypothetical protein [Planctomycetota bacterium]
MSLPRRVPVVGLILGLWVGLWVLAMGAGGWVWMRGDFWSFGAPDGTTLWLFGALVPAEFHWRSLFLTPLLHSSLLGLVFLLFFWRSVGSTLVGAVGPAWTWVVFVLCGMAGVLGHMEAYPTSMTLGGASPFDPILGAIGWQLGWGLVHREARALVKHALKTVLFVALWMALLLLATGTSLNQLRSPLLHQAIGLWAMASAFGVGLVLAFLMAALRRFTPKGTAVAGVALASLLALGVGTALALQAPLAFSANERSDARAFLAQLRRVEQGVGDILDQRRATPAKRDALAGEHARLASHPYVDQLAETKDFRAYVDALGLYLRPVEEPFMTEPRLRVAYRRWYEGTERALRESLAIEARAYDPWEGR